ncbi:MAG: hypothetical protein H6706_25850 [Myxococcales bacterium]|nr:hypothetical protein [Myxococcales bacterium]
MRAAQRIRLRVPTDGDVDQLAALAAPLLDRDADELAADLTAARAVLTDAWPAADVPRLARMFEGFGFIVDQRETVAPPAPPPPPMDSLASAPGLAALAVRVADDAAGAVRLDQIPIIGDPTPAPAVAVSAQGGSSITGSVMLLVAGICAAIAASLWVINAP